MEVAPTVGPFSGEYKTFNIVAELLKMLTQVYLDLSYIKHLLEMESKV